MKLGYKYLKKVENQVPRRRYPTGQRSVDCSVCQMLLAYDEQGIGAHFRAHIKKNEATREDYHEFLKSIGLYKEFPKN